MDPETLTLLLRGRHLSMPDRIALGWWPYPQLRLSDLVCHLAEVLRRETWFPGAWRPHAKGQVVMEGGFIEKQVNGYVYRSQRAAATNPCVLAEKIERTFTNAQDAASHYLKWDLHLPGDLDGWKVIE